MTITEIEREFQLGVPDSTKRNRVFDKTGAWVDTKPISVTHLESDSQVLKKVLAHAFKESRKKEIPAPTDNKEAPASTDNKEAPA